MSRPDNNVDPTATVATLLAKASVAVQKLDKSEDITKVVDLAHHFTESIHKHHRTIVAADAAATAVHDMRLKMLEVCMEPDGTETSKKPDVATAARANVKRRRLDDDSDSDAPLSSRCRVTDINIDDFVPEFLKARQFGQYNKRRQTRAGEEGSVGLNLSQEASKRYQTNEASWLDEYAVEGCPKTNESAGLDGGVAFDRLPARSARSRKFDRYMQWA